MTHGKKQLDRDLVTELDVSTGQLAGVQSSIKKNKKDT
jgi:hypothetical protein